MKFFSVAGVLSIAVVSIAFPFPAAADVIFPVEDDVVSIVEDPEQSDDLLAFLFDDGDSSGADFSSVTLIDGEGHELTEMDPNWWHGEGPVFATKSDSMIINFGGLPVVGFTFRIGSEGWAQAWIQANYTRDDGTSGHLKTGWFGGLNPNESPDYGVFVHGGGECATLDSVEVDPPFFWGLGEMRIATNDNCAVSVPEPGSLGLLGAGLLALGFVWHTRRRAMIALQEGLQARFLNRG